MVIGRALRATGCASCRLSLLRNFTSLAGITPIRAANYPAKAPLNITSIQQFRRITQLSHEGKENNVNENLDGREDVLQEEIDVTEDEVGLEKPAEDSQVEAIPWYLQVNPSQRATKPLSERQRIPDLPESPPPILEPLLQHLSIDLGLDDLKLLDLRKLDPPPALGANLFMVIGAARSEKHLHVSADRLCRWLRSEYKLRPDADGLLGRNELKLKLRRKAKRAKLLGSTSDENGDDGVRTGWVCVDVGVVEGGEKVTEEVPQHKDFVGFGRRTDGVRIVVQMLTEEKREEIDLERLWGGILKRGGQQEIPDLDSSIPQASLGLQPPSEQSTPTSALGQTRGYHTTARRMLTQAAMDLNLVKEPLMASPFENFDFRSIQESAMHDIVAGHYQKAKDDLIRYSEHVPQLQEGLWKPFLSTLLKTYLESLPEEQAIRLLGTGPDDRSSTPYLACFYETVSDVFPSQTDAESILWLQCFACDIGHANYDHKALSATIEQFRQDGVDLSPSAYMQVTFNLLRNARRTKHQTPSQDAVKEALKVLQAMTDRGQAILSEDVLVGLQEATSIREPVDIPAHMVYVDAADTFDLPSVPMPGMQQRLHVLMMHLDLPLFKDESRMRLLDLYAKNQHWLEFWEVFRMAPRRNLQQSSSIYAFMFACVAQTCSQKACMAVLRHWVPDMNSASPAIELSGEVAEAVKACVSIAEQEGDSAQVEVGL